MKRVAFILAPTVFAAAFATVGFCIGWKVRAGKHMGARINAFHGSTMYLGAVAGIRNEDIAQAYLDPEEALLRMNEITYVGFDVPSPFVGYAQLPGDRGTISINRQQMRANVDVRMPKPARTMRVFITGGSVAFGAGAPSNNTTIAGYLQKNLNERGELNYEVFAAASPAWASTQERIFIENRISEMQPDVIIAFTGNNDAHWGWVGSDILWFRSYADQLYWKLISTGYRQSEYRDEFIDLIRIDDAPVSPEIVAHRFRKNMSLAAGSTAAPLLVVLQPNLHTTQKKLTDQESRFLATVDPDRIQYSHDCYDKIRAASPENFHDLTGVFDGSQDTVFYDSYHFGDRGNKIVAQSLLELVIGLGCSDEDD